MLHEKKINRCGSFHIRYMELCRAKNYPPNTAIRSKNNATSVLDFFGDKLKVEDWLFVIESLRFDKIIQHLAIRLRKNIGNVIEHIDSEKKAKLFKQKPAVYTKYIFGGIIDAVTYIIQFNNNLTILCLEALPLNEKYAVSIAKALSSNSQLKQISFQRSPVGDKGCEAICSSIKCLPSIETLNVSECNLSVLSASHIGDMIKFQKICRYSEGWQRSLRYRDVDPNTISGLRVILLANNPNITDDGVKIIAEVLKEDVWIKIIDMENCGLTDIGANLISDCLAINTSIIDFNIKNNNEVSKFIHRNIRQQLGKDDDNSVESDEKSSTKISIAKLKERLKFMEEQLASEKLLRKQVEHLNEKLHNQILAYENQLAESKEVEIPEGYVLVKNESLESIINERNDLFTEASHTKQQTKTKNYDYLKKICKIRKVKSEMKYKQEGKTEKISKSDYKFNNKERFDDIVIEKNIGDTLNVNYQEPNITARFEKSTKDYGNDTVTSSESEEMSEVAEPFKVFIRKKQPTVENKCPSPRSLFLGLS